MNKSLLLIILVFFNNSLFSQESDFKLSDLSEIKGCPVNSTCSEKQGKQQSDWEDFLITNPSTKKFKKYMQKKGTPIRFFVLKSSENQDYISWDSHCPAHNRKDAKISIGQKFLKNFKELTISENNFYIPHIIKKNNKGKIVAIPTTQGVFPSHFNGDSVHSILQTNDTYYGLTTHANGDIEVSKPVSLSKYSQKVSCPNDLRDYSRTLKIPAPLSGNFYCRQIWDKKTKSYHVALLAEFCN